MAKYLDYNGLLYFWLQIKSALAGKVDTEQGKGLSSNDYTAADKAKLTGIDSGAEVNVLEGILVNGTPAPITSKVAAITTPTKTSDLTNDSDFITSADIPEGSAPTTTTPKMDGTAAVGSETKFARGDHVHPSDTSRQAKITANGMLKGNGSGGVSAAVAGTDYAAASHNHTVSQITDFPNLAGVYKYKGSVATYSALPSTGLTVGDVYNVEADGMNYAWTGSAWDALGASFSIDSITNAEIDTIVAS